MNPKELILFARKVRRRPTYHYADDYIETIILLREEKDRTYQEIGDFFKKHGIQLGWYSLRRAYKNYLKRKEQAESAIREAKELLIAK